MKHYFLFISLFIFYLEGSAQTVFQDAYIITLENDTLYGAADNRSGKINAQRCVFRDRFSNVETTYYPGDITGYRFTGGKFYISKAIPKEIRDGITDEVKKDTLFLEYLINGIADVYCYYDDQDAHYLIDNGGGRLIPLNDEKKEMMIDGQKHLVKSTEYRGVLNYLFRESPAVARKASRIPQLSHKSLIRVARDYHHEVCTTGESCIVYEKKLPKVTFGPLIGFNTYTLSRMPRRMPRDIIYFEEALFSTTSYPSIGVFLRKKFFNGNDKFFLHVEASYHGRTQQASSEEYFNGGGNVVRNEIEWTINSINTTGVVRYEFPRGKVRPVLQAGFAFDIVVKQDYYRTETHEQVPEGTVSETNTFSKPPVEATPDYSVVVGIGGILQTRSRPFFVDLKYRKGIRMLEYFRPDHFSLTVSTTFQRQ